VTDAELLSELAPVVEHLLARHLAAAREWFPHELVPWERGAQPEDEAGPLPEGVRSALVVNLLTEDNLPFYVTALHDRLGLEGPWGAWIGRWTAEEMRHATVIRDYITVTRAVDLVALERARMEHIARASAPTAPNVLEALVYVTLQEVATRIAHGNTGRALTDPAGRAIMTRVAADESLHHLFYRDVVSAALEIDPARGVFAVEAQARHFTMPGAGLPGFHDHAVAIADAGIYSATLLHEQVLVPVLLGHWRLGDLTGLRPDATAARDRTLRFVDRIGRLATRLPGADAPRGVSA
jgi:acyl-[acyl-carrier-protein] desaturase